MISALASIVALAPCPQEAPGQDPAPTYRLVDAFPGQKKFDKPLYFDHHPSDPEVYYVVEGKGKLSAGDHVFEANPGSILFVAKEVEHRFFDIEEDLTLVVFFSKAKVEDEDD